MKKIFIDGSSGTTGLRIRERLALRKDIEVIDVPYGERHNIHVRKQAADESDVTFLCLPDAAADEIAQVVSNETIIIDTSTAHRVESGWIYGLPELPGQRVKIKNANRIANPGCHATGFIVLIQPLIQAGILRKDVFLSCTSLTGYSGGGKKMIAQYEEAKRDSLLDSPRLYGIGQTHKHLNEMVFMTGLSMKPAFLPIVSDFYSGMETIIPLSSKDVNGNLQDIQALYQNIYQGPVIQYKEQTDENGFFAANALAGLDTMEITVSGYEERILLIARFDNLGKGASGAAIQNMNLALGFDETEGLILGGL